MTTHRPRRHLVVVPTPLPECRLCDRPTRRQVFEANSGVCTDCDNRIRDIAVHVGHHLPPQTSP